MGARGQVTTATEKLRDAAHDRGWSEEELAWVLDLPVELAEHLMWEVNVTPTLALRLEAAFEISAGGWYRAAGLPIPDLWLLADQMAGQLAGIRWRRYRLTHHRG